MNVNEIIQELFLTGKYKKCSALREYANLIVNNLKRHPHKAKGLQKHHIVPKSVCLELKRDTNYNGRNTVYMDPDSHTQAHNLLAMASKTMSIAQQSRGCGNISHDSIKKHLK